MPGAAGGPRLPLPGDLPAGVPSAAAPADHLDASVRSGHALARIVIPELGLDTVVVQGVTAAALRVGPGHYPGTPPPCAVGDVAIAGHRTTYERPFANINLLAVGDRVVLETAGGSCTYRVDRPPFLVPPHDWAVVAGTPGRATLTLTACAPKGSEAERIVVKAVMVHPERRG